MARRLGRGRSLGRDGSSAGIRVGVRCRGYAHLWLARGRVVWRESALNLKRVGEPNSPKADHPPPMVGNRKRGLESRPPVGFKRVRVSGSNPPSRPTLVKRPVRPGCRGGSGPRAWAHAGRRAAPQGLTRGSLQRHRQYSQCASRPIAFVCSCSSSVDAPPRNAQGIGPRVSRSRAV